MREITCPNEHCELRGRREHGNIVLHGYTKVR